MLQNSYILATYVITIGYVLDLGGRRTDTIDLYQRCTLPRSLCDMLGARDAAYLELFISTRLLFNEQNLVFVAS